LRSGLQCAVIHIAYGDNIAQPIGIRRITVAFAAYAYASEIHALVG